MYRLTVRQVKKNQQVRQGKCSCVTLKKRNISGSAFCFSIFNIKNAMIISLNNKTNYYYSNQIDNINNLNTVYNIN